ncbi:uncharacterized protein DUF3810 [Chitinophaga skermanii]|uniref:Uncharacterized protein DUF3810 n=1 Tax=Chitinophaga skermanii TaxID=331697 RepID=A0A327QEV1_9BACT|nr:DUF3810 domain-containing protein [Chitinophaga skermanii]RAJ02304.1 uncharacterized protein DUF3810 [Chitinophaga skermanii]
MENRINYKFIIIRIAFTLLGIVLLQFFINANVTLANFYFHRWYSSISTGLRYVLGKVPFSIGDVIYTIWILVAIGFFIRLIILLVKRQWKTSGYTILKAIHSVMVLYLAFLLLWGFNYQRNSLADDFDLPLKDDYSANDLYKLADTLVQLANANKLEVAALDSLAPKQMFDMAAAGFDSLTSTYPSLRYKHPCVKSSLYNNWLNYMGVTGYLNPFTLEAQVNTSVPGFVLPFTTCHEIGHQLGYAPEEDANFVGYIVASQHPDARFRYAANFEMLIYSVKQLRRVDTTLYRQAWEKVLPAIKDDYRTLRTFYMGYQSPVDEYSYILYDQYLKANNQDKGVASYSEVVGWLIAYFKKEKWAVSSSSTRSHYAVGY